MDLTSHLSDAYDAFLFFLLFFLLGADSDDDESDKSNYYGSGSRFTFGPFFSLRVELFSDQVICFFSSRVIINRVSILLIFSRSLIFYCSDTVLVSNSESLINLRYANFSLIVSLLP